MDVSHKSRNLRRGLGAVALACLPVGTAGATPLHITVTEAAGVYQIEVPGEVALYSTPVHYESIPRSEFAGRGEDLGGVLERSLGVQVRHSGGLGSFSTVSLRGAASEQVLIFVDGIPLNDAAGGGVDLSAFDLEELDRIEIYRGATPLELGGASIGGAVNLVTRKARGTQRRVLLGAGSFGTRQINAAASTVAGADRLLVNGGWRGSDNDFEFENDNGTAFNPDDDFIDRRNNADFQQRNLLLKWQRELDSDAEMTAAVQGFAKDQGLPDQGNSDDASARFDTESLRAHLRAATHALRGNPRLSASGGLFAEYKAERFDDRDSQIGLLSQHTRGTTRRLGAESFVNRIDGATSVRATAEVSRESYRHEDLRGLLDTSLSERRAATAGLELNRYLLDNRLILSGVARQQWIEDHLEVAGGGIGNAPVDADDYHSFFSPQVGVKYVLDARSHLKANLGRYARIPAFFELFGDRGFFLGNADLEPETGINLDLGVQYTWFAPQSWFNDAQLDLELFYNRARDLIVRVFNARGVGRSENVADAVIRGLSLALTLQPADDWQTSLAVSLLDTRIDSDLVSFDGNRLPNRFAETYRLGGAWSPGAWRLSAAAVVRRGMYFDTPNLLEADTQEQLDLALRYRFRDWHTELRIDNALDEPLQDFNGFPRPGRLVLLTAGADF